MEFVAARNALIKLMSKHLQTPIILSDQTTPETEYPYIYYTVINPPQGLSGSGDNRIKISGDDVITVRHDQPTVTLSFTACSRNRKDENGKMIYGEDEAIRLSESAKDYLEHIGYHDLSDAGITIVEITNSGMRSGLVFEEIDRRYGFDCRIRFETTTCRNDGSVDYINTKRSDQ